MSTAHANRTVWLDTRDDTEPVLHLGGVERVVRDFGFAAMPTELAGVSATQLRHALDDAVAVGFDGQLIVSAISPEYFDDDVIASDGIEFTVDDDGLVMQVYVGLTEWNDDEDDLTAGLGNLLADLLRRNRCELISAGHNLSYVGEPPFPSHLLIRPRTHGRTVADLSEAGVEFAALVDASEGGVLVRPSTVNLLRAGHAAALIGQPEGAWLDVKKQLYDITKLRGKVSLAQAVTRFANSKGGVVVFGMDAKKVGSGEVIAKLYPVPTDGHTIRKHRQVLESHVYPLPEAVELDIVPAAGGTLLVVHVPPQPEAAKPFLVHGAIVDEDTEGAFISIVRRHGEDSIPTTAPAVHAAMSINRILDRLEASSKQSTVGGRRHPRPKSRRTT